MQKPNCKILVYDTDSDLVYTLTSDILECHTKDILTSGVGTFKFTLPAQTATSTYVYDDIGNNYTSKIYFGWDGSYTHLFTGKIKPFTSKIGKENIRVFEGRSLSELLERRHKTNKRWQDTAANAIVAELCDSDNLDISSSIDTDVTEETITVNTESYFDVLKKVSDYWYDATTQVKSDFYIDKDGELQWKTRPIRSTGVESFVYGTDFLEYDLKYDILDIKNYITIKGAATAPVPLDYLTDVAGWTDSLTDWTASSGTLSLDAEANHAPAANTPAKAGDYWITCEVNGTTKIAAFKRSTPTITTRSINKLSFWHSYPTSAIDVAKVILYTDSTNYFLTKSGALSTVTGDHFNELAIGDSAMYDADENPTGVWEEFGSPNWYNINEIGFLFHNNDVGTPKVYIDKIWFYPERWSATAFDATSIASYEQSDAEYTDNNLQSELECQQRVETLLYQQKDRVLRLDFSVIGNTNVLIGDRLSITLPPDNLTAVSFDVLSVEHHFDIKNGYITAIHAVDAGNTRKLPSTTPLEAIQNRLSSVKSVISNVYENII